MIFILLSTVFLIIANRDKKDTPTKEKTALPLVRETGRHFTRLGGSLIVWRVQGPFGPAADIHLAALSTPSIDGHGPQVVHATRGAVIGVDPDVVAAPQNPRAELIVSPPGTTRVRNIHPRDRRPGLIDDPDVPRFLRRNRDRHRHGTNHSNKRQQDFFHSYSFRIAR